MEEAKGFHGWCVVELMGHVTLAGYVSEAEVASSKMLCITIPESEHGPSFSKFIGMGSIYGITPVDEETVAALCAQGAQKPFTAWQLTKAFEAMFQRRVKEVARLEGPQDEEDEDHEPIEDSFAEYPDEEYGTTW